MTERDRNLRPIRYATDGGLHEAAVSRGVFRRVRRLRRRGARRAILHVTRASPESTPQRADGARCPRALKLRRAAGAGPVLAPDVLLARRARPTTSTSIRSAGWRAALNNYDATMVIISHDRHFLNQVCTHMRTSTSSS